MIASKNNRFYRTKISQHTAFGPRKSLEERNLCLRVPARERITRSVPLLVIAVVVVIIITIIDDNDADDA